MGLPAAHSGSQHAQEEGAPWWLQQLAEDLVNRHLATRHCLTSRRTSAMPRALAAPRATSTRLKYDARCGAQPCASAARATAAYSGVRSGSGGGGGGGGGGDGG